MKKININRIGSTVGVLIVLGIVIMVNVILSPIRLRSDVTDENLYTLSSGTKQLLKELDRDVTIKFYFSKSNEQLPVPFKNFAGRVRDLLKEYESRAGGRLVVEEYDPKPDSDEEEWAQRYGLQGQALDMFGLGGDLYFGIVAVSGNREAAIPMIAQSVEPRLEYLLTRMVSEITRDKMAKLGIMSALPVQGGMPPSMNPMMRQSPTPAWAIVSELESQYEIESVEMNATEIPEDIDTLIVIHPMGISDDALYALDQFVLRGGRLLAFTDPASLAAQESMAQQMKQFQMPQQHASDLNKLTSAWGITMDTTRVASDESAASMLSAGNGQAQRNAAWLMLREPHISRDEVATASLSQIMLPFAGAFDGTVAAGLEKTVLLTTADDGKMTSAMEAQLGAPSRTTGTGKALPLAVRLKGKFKTAFPNGKPGAAAEEGEEKKDEGLKESAKDGIVILVADADLLYDRFCIQRMNVFGQTLLQPANDNLNFAVNMIEQLTGSEALIGLRSRGSFNRPFDKVLALEKEAQIRWQAEEQRLNTQLQETQARLNELQSAKGEDQQFIMSPEQEAEIKKFRQEVFNNQQALKEVRKNLRRDIEKLGTRLKVINIAGIPLLVAIFGIVRGVWIKKTR
jgi:ABC-type uncharacterized transport system involved in gliding motility auxiliary subunit